MPTRTSPKICTIAAVFIIGFCSPIWAEQLREQVAAQPDQIYQEAVRLYQEKNYSESLLKFFKLQELQPDYKDSESYMRKIEDYLSFKEQQKLNEESLLRQQEFKALRLRRIEERLAAEQKRIRDPGAIADRLQSEDVGAPATTPHDITEPDQGREEKEIPSLSGDAGAESMAQKEFTGEAFPEVADAETIPTADVPSKSLIGKIRDSIFAPQELLEKRKEEKLARKRQHLADQAKARERQELIRNIKRTYREANASYKAGLFNMSREEVASLNEMLGRENLPTKFREEMQGRVERIAHLLEGQNEDRRASDRYLIRKEQERKASMAAVPSQVQEKESKTDLNPSAVAEVVSGTDRPLSAREKKFAQKAERRRQVEQARQEKSAAKQRDQEARLAQKEEQRKKALEAKHARETKKVETQMVNAQKQSQQEFREMQKRMINWQVEEARDQQAQKTEELRRHKATMEDEKTQSQKELRRGVNELYNDAIVYYAQGALGRAERLMKEVDQIWPDYKLCRSYLELIRQQKENPSNAISQAKQEKLSLTKDRLISDSLDAMEKNPPSVQP